MINSLRGIATIGVFLVHSLGEHLTEGHYLKELAKTGWFGVNLFFLLSGFVLCLPFVEEDRVFSLKKFYQNRISRLYPLFMIAGLLGLFFYSGKRPLDLEFWKGMANLPTTLYFAYHGLSGADVYGNGPFWSLAIEIYLSILFPLLLVIFQKIDHRRACFFVFIFLFITDIIVGFKMDKYGSPHFYALSHLIIVALREFCLGIFLAFSWKGGEGVRWIKLPKTTFLVSAAILFCVVSFFKSHINPSYGHLTYIHTLRSLVFYPLADLALFFICYICSFFTRRSFPLNVNQLAIATYRHDVLLYLYLAHAFVRPIWSSNAQFKS